MSAPIAARVRAWPLLVFPSVKLAIQVAALPGYGWFRDEFYYLACARRLDFGYVDHPPLSILLLRVWTDVFGVSLWAIRLLPALTGAATVLLVGLICRDLGGRRHAQVLAMTAAVAAPQYLGTNHIFSMNALDVLFWTLAAWLVVRIGAAPAPRRWIALGVVLGLGLQNKVSVLWLGAGLAVGLLATSQGREALRTRGPWAAAAIAGAIFLPHVVWQIAHGWPTVEFVRNAAAFKMSESTPWEFLGQQVLIMNPVAAPVWIAGAIWLAVSPAARAARPLVWIYVTVLAILALSPTAKAYYLAPAYGWLLAAGGVAMERGTGRFGGRTLRAAAIGAIAGAGLVLAPFALPVLPVDRFIGYSRALGLESPADERHELGPLPQFYADMHGWSEHVRAVAQVYDMVAPEERPSTVIFTQNYGMAGALELLGAPLGLARVSSTHNSYWLWGPPSPEPEVAIVVGDRRERLEEFFAQVEIAGRTGCAFCMPYEHDQPIWICRGPRRPLAEVWPDLRNFI